MMDAKEKPMKPLFNLKEKNVLVTGGGRGLGKTMALALADFGANVAWRFNYSYDESFTIH